MKCVKSFLFACLCAGLLLTGEGWAHATEVSDSAKNLELSGEEYTKTAANQYVQTPPGSNVYRDSYLVFGKSLSDDERYAIRIGDATYYSEYGFSAQMWGKAIEYPIQEIGTEVILWTEQKDGSTSTQVNETVRECDLSECKVSMTAYQKQLTGSIS